MGISGGDFLQFYKGLPSTARGIHFGGYE